jgi:hypothetical protein
MSFHLSFHTASLGPTGAYWLDDPSDLSCKEATRQHALDVPLLSCKQQVGGSSLPSDTRHDLRLRPQVDSRRLLGQRFANGSTHSSVPGCCGDARGGSYVASNCARSRCA